MVRLSVEGVGRKFRAFFLSVDLIVSDHFKFYLQVRQTENGMTCNHCCGAEKIFDLKGANKELKKYEKKGPRKSTKKLIDLIFTDVETKEKSLLDIGGGIGAIQWEFLRRGGSHTHDVDASLAYLNVSEAFANKHEFIDKASFIHGDFVDVSGSISNTDFVTLDKVLCCYPDYQSLLEKALEKCDKSIGVVYPLGGLIPKIIAQFNKLYFYIRKNPFRTYIHSPKKIEKFILSHGFKTHQKSISFPWHVQVYKRIG